MPVVGLCLLPYVNDLHIRISIHVFLIRTVDPKYRSIEKFLFGRYIQEQLTVTLINNLTNENPLGNSVVDGIHSAFRALLGQ